MITASLVTCAGMKYPDPDGQSSNRAAPTMSGTVAPVYWKPGPNDRLQIQFSGLPVVLMDEVDVYDLDLFDTDRETIQTIHAAGARAICYINAGAWEDWRPDAGSYPKDIIGKDYEGWPGEKWLDIRRIKDLEPLLSARFDLCRQKGFDGIEPDNLDGYQNDTGFHLSGDDQITFNTWLADMAHAQGLSIGLKNDPDQMAVLEDSFDFTIMEECLVSNWCEASIPFIRDGKPAYAVEYTDQIKSLAPYCQSAIQTGLFPLLKNRELNAFRQTCK